MSQLRASRLPVILALLALLAAVAVSSWWPPADTESAHEDVYIYIRDNQYWTASGTSAQTVTIPAGTTVVWVNQDPWWHTVTGTGGCVWPCPTLHTGDTVSFKFTAQVTYDYYCEIHSSWMKGRIVVGPPETATPLPTSTPTATATPTPTPTSTPRPPSMVVHPPALAFLADPTIAATGRTSPQTIFMNNAGDLPYDWQATSSAGWLELNPTTGRSGQTNPQVSVLLSQALAGHNMTQSLTRTGTITVTQITSPTKTQTVNVTFRYSRDPLVRSYFPVLAGGPVAPNNSFAQAAFIGSSAMVQGTIRSATEVDYFTFNVRISPGTANINLDNLPADFNLYLYDSAQTLLTSSEQTGTTAENINWGGLAAGKYYIKVAGAAGAFSDFPYRLQLTETEPVPTPSITPTSTATATATPTVTPTATPVDRYEPNNTLWTAFPITPTTTLTPYHGAVTSVNDLDWFKFTVSQSTTIQLRLFVLSNSNYDLYLYGPNMILAASNIQPGTASEWIDYIAPIAGTYFAEVMMGQNGSPSDIGYDLYVGLTGP